MTRAYYHRMNHVLESQTYLAANRYSMADITAAIAIDFAITMVDLKPEAELDKLWTWYKHITSRAEFVS